MDWVRENGFWIVVGILFLWMHTKMHGGHGHGGHGHGGHRHGSEEGHDGHSGYDDENRSEGRPEGEAKNHVEH